MKTLGRFFGFGCLLCMFNSCVIFNGAAVWGANSEIEKSTLNEENAEFQTDTDVNLVFVKRAVWSMHDTFQNKKIKSYFDSLLENKLVYSFDNAQTLFLQQKIIDDKIHISVNSQILDYSQLEKSILLGASTSVLALYGDEKLDNKKRKDMFFKQLNLYDPQDIPSIFNAQWFKNKNLTLSDNALTIGS